MLLSAGVEISGLGVKFEDINLRKEMGDEKLFQKGQDLKLPRNSTNP